MGASRHNRGIDIREEIQRGIVEHGAARTGGFSLINPGIPPPRPNGFCPRGESATRSLSSATGAVSRILASRGIAYRRDHLESVRLHLTAERGNILGSRGVGCVGSGVIAIAAHSAKGIAEGIDRAARGRCDGSGSIRAYD